MSVACSGLSLAAPTVALSARAASLESIKAAYDNSGPTVYLTCPQLAAAAAT
jgi:hypothetical protein